MCLYSVDFDVFLDVALCGLIGDGEFLVTQLTGMGGDGVAYDGYDDGFKDDEDGCGCVWK